MLLDKTLKNNYVQVLIFVKLKNAAKSILVDAVKESFGRFGMEEIKGFLEG